MTNTSAQVAPHQVAPKRSSVRKGSSGADQCLLEEVQSEDLTNGSGELESVMEVEPHKGRKRHADNDSEPPSSWEDQVAGEEAGFSASGSGDVPVLSDPLARKKTRSTPVISFKHSFAPLAHRLVDVLRPGSRPIVPK